MIPLKMSSLNAGPPPQAATVMGENLPKQCELTSLTHLSRKEISILQFAANEMTDTTHQYYHISLSLGLNNLLLKNNLHRPRLEMFLATRINNYIHLTPKQFLTDIINKKVQTNVSGMFQYVDFIKDFDGAMDMSHWCITEPEREWVEYVSTFQSLVTLIMSMDKIEYDYHVDRVRENPPTTVNIFYIEIVPKMINKRGNVNVNEILFQPGLTVKDLKRAADGCKDVSSWDMHLIMFQALPTLWTKETKGRPIDNMWMFTGLFTQAVKHSPNSYTVQALVSLFMPQRLYDYGGTKLAWVHDSMLKNWQNIQRMIMDKWGAAKGFSTYTDSGEEDEDCPEDDTVED